MDSLQSTFRDKPDEDQHHPTTTADQPNFPPSPPSATAVAVIELSEPPENDTEMAQNDENITTATDRPNFPPPPSSAADVDVELSETPGNDAEPPQNDTEMAQNDDDDNTTATDQPNSPPSPLSSAVNADTELSEPPENAVETPQNDEENAATATEQLNSPPPPLSSATDADIELSEPPPPQNDTETAQNDDETESESDPTTSNDTEKPATARSQEDDEDIADDDEDDEDPPPKKQKQLSSLTEQQKPDKTKPNDSEIIKNDNAENEAKMPTPTTASQATSTKKKSKKKNNNNVWVTRSTRKGKKKTKQNTQNTPAEDTVLITPVPRFPDKNDDSLEMKICLSKVYKAEKVELSEDRLSAGSTKGYRMVRATRGVCEGTWYYEIKVVSLGESGHTRLGWSMEKGDLQAPVGYDGNSFGYRDVDGSKVHKALREKYGEEGYKEGDVIGFYINLPDGEGFAPKPPHLVCYKGQRYVCCPDAKEDPPKVVPGSEISFFKNGVCQGVAFKDLYGGRYYPAASMYTLPNQPNCVVKFNFGPDFEFFPEDFGVRPIPKPMVEVPYDGFDSRVENGVSNDKNH